jgi:hypothetical protein
MRAAVISACVIGVVAAPAAAQSLFGFFGDDRPATPEEKWKMTICRQIAERAPRLNLGRGRVVAEFHIDRAGRVTDVKFPHYSSDAHALVVASVISSLKLQPPPASAGKSCCFFRHEFLFR